MTDQDGDSLMHNLNDSSSDRSTRSSSMFPDEIAHTPPLSQSQSNHDRSKIVEPEDTLMDEANEQAQRQAHVMAGSPKSSDILSDPVTGEAFETDETAPGYAWKNRRAVDEYDKMSEIILDRNFSLEEFGDTVLDSLREDEAEYDPYAPLGLSIDTR